MNTYHKMVSEEEKLTIVDRNAKAQKQHEARAAWRGINLADRSKMPLVSSIIISLTG